MDADLWLPFKEVFTYIKRRYIKDLTMPTMVKTLKGNHRFMVQILTTGRSSDGSRERGMGNLAYTIVNVKCIQGHCRTVTDHPERSLIGSVIPGGVSSEKPFVFLTKESPWEIMESGDKELIKLRPICLALDVELMAMQGYRLLESESGHYLTEDWISNVCLMYAYDFQQDQYLWTARAYPIFRKDLNNTV